jgi:hypothetical protein
MCCSHSNMPADKHIFFRFLTENTPMAASCSIYIIAGCRKVRHSQKGQDMAAFKINDHGTIDL